MKTKSTAASNVLQLMDQDFEYCEALKIALEAGKTINKKELENELNIYI